MEAIRKFIDASALMSIMALSEAFRNRKLEIIVLPADKDTLVWQEADGEDVVQSFVGAIPYTGLTLAELRDEKLGKYEAAD